jgi:cytoskeletal protein CcmA (bactofilin family)
MVLRRSASEPDTAARAAPEGTRAGTTTGDSLIAVGTVVDGDCRTDGALVINGHVKGSVEAARLVVGPQGRIDGDVTSRGSGGAGDPAVTIDGRIGGAVRAERVEVGREGAVGGGMKVREAVVRGRVVGAIVTDERLLLEETAVIEGDVTARRLGLKEGGQVAGTIRIGEPRAAETGRQSAG